MSNEKEITNPLKEGVDAVTGIMYEELTPEIMSLIRISGLAGGSVCFLAIMSFLEIDELSASLYIALTCFSIALPAHIASAMLAETYIWLGEESFEHYSKVLTSKFGQSFAVGIWLLIFIGVGFTIAHISWLIALLYLAMSLISAYLVTIYFADVGNYLKRKNEK